MRVLLGLRRVELREPASLTTRARGLVTSIGAKAISASNPSS